MGRASGGTVGSIRRLGCAVQGDHAGIFYRVVVALQGVVGVSTTGVIVGDA